MQPVRRDVYLQLASAGKYPAADTGMERRFHVESRRTIAADARLPNLHRQLRVDPQARNLCGVVSGRLEDHATPDRESGRPL